MDRLWAPWRKKFMEKCDKKKECIFCTLPRQKKDAKNFIVHRAEHAYVILNRYPYNNGHIMVAPYRHIQHLKDLTPDEHSAIFELLAMMEQKLKKILRPDGFNVGINLGKSAGAGFAGHLHVHMVPRWTGDTNFFPVLGSTKVISESLESFYKSLKKML